MPHPCHACAVAGAGVALLVFGGACMFLYARFMKKTPPPKKAKKGKKGKKGGKDKDKGGGKKKGDAKLKKHSDLPKHWEEHFDDDGTPYYFNTKTDEVCIARGPSHGNASPRTRGRGTWGVRRRAREGRTPSLAPQTTWEHPSVAYA